MRHGHDRLAQRRPPVGLEVQRLLDAVVGVLDAGPVRLHAHGVDAGVGPAAAGHLLERLDDAVDLHVVDGLGAALLPGQPEPLGEAVDGDHPLGPQQVGAPLRHEPDAAAAPDGDRVAGLDVAEVGPHVAGGGGVGEEEHLLVGHALGGVEAVVVGERDADVLGVRPGVAAEGVGVAVDAGRRVAEHRHLQLGLRVRVVAEREELVLAVPALAADDERRDDHAVALLDLLHLGAGLDHLAHELVADDVAGLHRRQVAVDEVQVRAAGRRQRHLQDGVVGVDDRRVGDGPDSQVVHAVPVECSHRDVLLSGCRRVRPAAGRWWGSRRSRPGPGSSGAPARRTAWARSPGASRPPGRGPRPAGRSECGG